MFQRGSRWIASIGRKGKSNHLGSYVTKDEALAVRREAEEVGRDNFSEWFVSFKHRRKARKAHPVGLINKGGRWVATIGRLGKSYHLGSYDSIDEALAVRKEAEYVGNDNFSEWYAEFRLRQYERKSDPHRRKDK